MQEVREVKCDSVGEKHIETYLSCGWRIQSVIPNEGIWKYTVILVRE